MLSKWTIDRIILAPGSALAEIEFQIGRIQELLETTNRYLERARTAERLLRGPDDAEERALIERVSAHVEANEGKARATFSIDGIKALLRMARRTATTPPSPSVAAISAPAEPCFTHGSFSTGGTVATPPAPSVAVKALDETELRRLAAKNGWYVRESASVPDLKNGGWKHPFSVTLSSNELIDLVAIYSAPAKQEGA